MEPSQTELAEALGMSKANVTKLKQQGMPVHSLAAAREWRARRQNIAARKPDAAAPAAPPPAAPAYVGSESFDEARTRREVAAANLLELELAEARGDLLRRDVMEQTVGALATGTREAVLQVVARLASLVAAESDPVKVRHMLEAELRQALDQSAAAA